MRFATFALLLPCLFGPAARATEPMAPLAMTTDSVSYCDNLARRVSPPSASAEVVRLAREGTAMCDRGQVRGGIMQLRRALLLARGGRAAAP